MENLLTNSLNQNLPQVSSGKILNPQFYGRSAVTVAQDLLGKGLFIQRGKTELLCEIVETEAYLGAEDPASHAYRGVTPRNWPMFEGGGTVYVYLSYGINYCFNVVTGKKGVGEAVLVRAAIPVVGLLDMARRRKLKEASPYQILSGPGKLTQALGITLRDNGTNLYERDFCILDLGRTLGTVGQSSRIGITKGTDSLFRFFITRSPWLSRRT